MRCAVRAPEHNKIACRAWLAASVVVVRVMSASVLSVVVPATAESSNAVMLSLTVWPQVPLNSPVTGSARPSSEVDAVAMVRPYANRMMADDAVLAGICTVNVVVLVLSEPKSMTAMALLLLLLL